MMTVKQILSRLEGMSNESTLKHNIKSRAGKNQFGVKLGDIRNLANKIKSDHDLALELWKTKNIDARLLACLIIKPKSLSLKEMDVMVKSIDFVQLADWFNAYILKNYPEKEELWNMWKDSKNKWALRSWWSMTAGKIARSASNDDDSVDPAKILKELEKDMPKAEPEVQWTMNTALANTGIYHPKLRKEALRIGEKLGIYRDYPVSKGCTSPFAPIWIKEMVKRGKG